jgi:LMBR1 domain-containing protein 1
MVDVFLIVLTVVVPLLVLALSGYIVVYYSHPDDAGSYWSKTLLILSISLSILGVLLIPLDVANLSGTVGCGVFGDCGELDLSSLWQAFYIAVAVFVIILIPYTIFFYESYDKTKSLLSQGCSAFCWQLTSTVIAILVFVVMFVFLKYTEIPVKE